MKALPEGQVPRVEAAGGLVSLLSLLAFSSTVAASLLPRLQAVGLGENTVILLVASAVMGAAASHLLPRLLSEPLASGLRAADSLYRGAKTGMGLAARVNVVEEAAAALESNALMGQLRGLWPLVAAGAGLPGLYVAAASYAEAYRAAVRLGRLMEKLGGAPPPRCNAPRPRLVSLALAATLGLAGPLAGRWMRRLASCLEARARALEALSRARQAPGEGGEAAGREKGEEQGGEESPSAVGG